MQLYDTKIPDIVVLRGSFSGLKQEIKLIFLIYFLSSTETETIYNASSTTDKLCTSIVYYSAL